MGELSQETREALSEVATATLTTVMIKKGVRTTWIAGAKPFSATKKRIVGPAFTLRFIPAREDLATPAAWSSPRSTRAAIEDMPEGCICVIDARGETAAGVGGDILLARMKKRGVAGLVTDGVVRDGDGVKGTGLPVWCAGTAAPASIHALEFAGWQEPIGCGGVAVMAGDVVVADGDGAVVIPQAMVEEVAAIAVEQEKLEAWIVREVDRGVPLPGLYPPNDETMARYRNDTQQGGENG